MAGLPYLSDPDIAAPAGLVVIEAPHRSMERGRLAQPIEHLVYTETAEA